MSYRPKHLDRWSLPSCYAGATWEDYYVFLSRHRDSDCLTNANFDAGLKAIGGERTIEIDLDNDPESPNPHDLAIVQVVRESHWAVGWIEWIAVHKTASKALKLADKAAKAIQDYPVLDENLYSEYEQNYADLTWKNCYSWQERAEYIRENWESQFQSLSFVELLANVRGLYFSGSASELIN